MSRENFPYCIPDRRALNDQERNLLRFLLEREAPDRVSEIDNLHVVARCGCGECPTVLFGQAENDEPVKPHPLCGSGGIIADYYGPDGSGELVGVILWDRQGQLAELEAWSLGGDNFEGWPDPENLRRLD